MEDNDSIIIDLSKARSKGNSNKYFCSYCNTRLTPLTEEDKIGGYLCTKCIITYWPNQQPVKKANRLETPGSDTDSHGDIIGNNIPPVAIIDESNSELSSTSYKQQKLPAAYATLGRQGFKWISYEER
jgi:hypothetical protein